MTAATGAAFIEYPMMAVNRTKDPVRGVFYPASILKAVSSLLLHRPMLGWDSALKSSDSQFAFGGRMQQGPSNYPKFQIYGKILSSSEVVCRSENCAAHRKKMRVFSAFYSRSRAGYVQRAETIVLSSLDDPRKKIASVRDSTISPVIASSRHSLLLRGPGASDVLFGLGVTTQDKEVA